MHPATSGTGLDGVSMLISCMAADFDLAHQLKKTNYQSLEAAEIKNVSQHLLLLVLARKCWALRQMLCFTFISMKVNKQTNCVGDGHTGKFAFTRKKLSRSF